MFFDTIPTELQNIYMVQFEFLMKFLFIGFIVFICIYWINKTKKQEKTPYLLVGLLRGMGSLTSYGVLFLMPIFSIYMLYPQFEWNILLQVFTIGYIVLIFIVTTVFILNVLYFTPTYLLGLAGLDLDAERNSKLMNELEKIGFSMKTKLSKKGAYK